MSNEKTVDLVAVHEIYLGNNEKVAPGKPFSTDEKTAEYLVSIGAAKAPKAEAAAEPEISAEEAAAAAAAEAARVAQEEADRLAAEQEEAAAAEKASKKHK